MESEHDVRPPAYGFESKGPGPGLKVMGRREEELLIKDAKTAARKQCHPLVEAFANCNQGRTVSTLWACQTELKAMQECMRPLLSEKVLDGMRMEFMSDAARQERRERPPEVKVYTGTH